MAGHGVALSGWVYAFSKTRDAQSTSLTYDQVGRSRPICENCLGDNHADPKMHPILAIARLMIFESSWTDFDMQTTYYAH
ncbi:uncharacterized protein LTR77_010381 [Saxophila tyrrhenica]|uniref:Uncharacterized protein n=1 Tax=Saxophila tyrrhenica TaxID=1690608 RepID=A0AAV9NXY6_9PEZI|nr:hypothetical protein LTR77_010381 [Saxophila tyrrhenica]